MAFVGYFCVFNRFFGFLGVFLGLIGGFYEFLLYEQNGRVAEWQNARASTPLSHLQGLQVAHGVEHGGQTDGDSVGVLRQNGSQQTLQTALGSGGRRRG